MIRNALIAALRGIFRYGNFKATFADGSQVQFGDNTGEPVHIRFCTPTAERKMLLNPGLGFPESYMDQEIEFLEGDVWSLMVSLFGDNNRSTRVGWRYILMDKMAYVTRRLKQFNSVRKARRNVAHHYDLNVDFYDLFLDSDRQYSCAYFEHDGQDLAEAQLAKKRHLVSKLNIGDGNKVLDIGCGFGGMGLYLANAADVEVTGITLSKEQLMIARQRAKDSGSDDRVRFELTDYRDLKGKFDRIVSVGMFEHVGLNHYQRYFDKCFELLADDGVFVLHSIGRHNGPGYTHPFIEKYIFPGGYIPALSEVIPSIERAGFHITDIEILRLHYARTIRAWRDNFKANRDRAREMYDEKFCRMWEFYLAGSESSFRHQMMMNFQIQMTKKRETLPITRSYMSVNEENLQ